MANTKATPAEATTQVAAVDARDGSERRGSEDSVEQRHRKILVFAHVGRKARDAARQACTQLYSGTCTVMTLRSGDPGENWDDPSRAGRPRIPWRS